MLLKKIGTLSFILLLSFIPVQPQSDVLFKRHRCSRNEELKECGTACEPTCSNPSPICTLQCIPNVCQCSTGFLRHSVTGKCVRQNRCPSETTTSSPAAQSCRANETFTECGSACEPSCTSSEARMCTLQCIVDVCQCSQGFVRGPNGCVKKEDC
uniref:TIL domain-containing protein n=1 Tax=Caenorhabditis japonica TaxID=281687 RepID=A0A8R1HPW3_CAEJA